MRHVYLSTIRTAAAQLGQPSETPLTRTTLVGLLGPFAADTALVARIAASTDTEAAAWEILLRAEHEARALTHVHATYAGRWIGGRAPATPREFFVYLEREAAIFARQAARGRPRGRRVAPSPKARYRTYVAALRDLGLGKATVPSAHRTSERPKGPSGSRTSTPSAARPVDPEKLLRRVLHARSKKSGVL